MFSASGMGERLNRYHDMNVAKMPLQSHASIPIDMSAMKTSTWTYKPATVLQPISAEKHLRFRGEKSSRRPLQRLQWRRGKWSPTDGDGVNHLDLSMVGSMTIADVSPKFAVKRIVMLHENLQYKEAANFINRLNHGTFKVILPDLPVDVLIDSMPGSIPILESLYAKVFLSDGLDFSLKTLRPESVVLQMVKSFAQQEGGTNPNTANLSGNAQFVASCKKLLKVIIHAEPNIRKMLVARKKAIEKAIEGMGHHGMVGNADGSMMNLHDALKLEFQRVVASYKAALLKLEELSLSSSSKQSLSRTVSHGPAPIQASHQRQLSITQQDIQERLIKNKTILNVVEPILGSHSLDVFLGILQRRIDYDKDCLFQFTQLKKEANNIHQINVVAPVLMRFSQGIEQVLKLMREVSGEQDESEGSDISGYHSDSDSAIMTSGNSPYVSKSARYNFLYRSVRATPTQFRGAIPSFSLSTPSVSVGSGPSTASDTPSEGGKSIDTPLPPTPAPAVAPSASSPVTHQQEQKSRARSHSLAEQKLSSLKDVSRYSDRELTCSKGHTLALPPANNLRDEHFMKSVKSIVAPSSNDPASYNISVQRNRVPATNTDVIKLNSTFRQDTTSRTVGRQSASNLPASSSTAALASDNITHIRVDGVKTGVVFDVGARAAPESPPGERTITKGSASERDVVRRYDLLYNRSRSSAMEALDALPELRDSDELKSKLLFSIVVLAFRSACSTRQSVGETVRRQLQIPPPPPPEHRLPPGRQTDISCQRSRQLQIAVNSFLQQTAESYDLTASVEDVCRQIWATLYDYPCLRSSEGLLSYVKECVRLSWSIINQESPCRIEYEQRSFSDDLHERHSCSDLEREEIVSYVWPALVDEAHGCVYKAVVIT